jgi:Phytanoyl-CoA dioxygenase (PhyH)
VTTATFSDEHVLSPEDLEHFETEGYVTLSWAVPNEQVSAAVDAIWQFLGMDRNNPEDWYRSPHSPNSLVEIYQHQAFWDNRQSPRIYRAFSQLWGTEKLWVSLDRACMKPPADPNRPDWQWPSFMHWDFDLGKEMPAQFGVQGVLCLSDTSEDQGGFHCIPGMHREVIEWSKMPPDQREPKVLPFERSRVRSISAKAGDMILWHRALPHGSGINRTNRPRIAQYILAAPAGYNVSIYQPQEGASPSAIPAYEVMRQQRIAQWERRIGCGGPTLDPREAGPPAILTPLGRRLLGLDLWE